MRAVLKVARHEISSLRRVGRFRLGAWIGVCLLIGLTLLSWQAWRTEKASRASFESAQREQWEDQGEKHPHRAAHFGFYLIKPELSLALFDSGVKPVTGQTLWLEAHTRSSFSFAPLEDAGAAAALGLTNGAEALQLLGPLLVIVAGFGCIAREREDGTLRLVLAQGVSPLSWFVGKCLGLAASLSFIAIPVGGCLLALCYLADPSAWNLDTMLRALLLVAMHVAYLSVWLALALAVSAWAKTGRQALSALLAFWIAGGVLAPRVASFVASKQAPTPSVAEWRHSQQEAFGKGFGSERGWTEQLAKLERDTLDKYGVDTLDELPIGFSGLRMLEMSAFSDRISDHFQSQLEELYQTQEAWRLSAAAVSPYIAMRKISQSLAGMDWAHYLRFAAAAEVYRREVVRQLDQQLETRLSGNQWEIDFGREDWESVPSFEYKPPTLAWSLRHAGPALAALFAWLGVAGAFAYFAARRIRP